MPRTLPVPPLGSFEFSSEFLPEEVDYSEAFDFGVDFSFLPEVDFLATSTPGDDDFEYDNVSCDVSFVSYVSLLSDPKRRRQKKRKKRSKNRTNYRASVRTSCWYINYLAPGHVRELTHELVSHAYHHRHCRRPAPIQTDCPPPTQTPPMSAEEQQLAG